MRWGIETTFRVHDEVKIKTKSPKPIIRYALFLFECMLYNLWQFFKGYLTFRRFVNTLFRMSITKAVVLSTIEIIKAKGILAINKPPPDEIYKEVIDNFGYNEGISLH